jgi:hypothetical protein
MTYIFFRKDGFYPIEETDDARIIEHIKLNPGTLKVEDCAGRLIWSQDTDVAYTKFLKDLGDERI